MGVLWGPVDPRLLVVVKGLAEAGLSGRWRLPTPAAREPGVTKMCPGAKPSRNLVTQGTPLVSF